MRLNNYFKSKLASGRYFKYALLWLMMLPLALRAQVNSISGTVKDESGKAVPGVSVNIKGKQGGTQTDNSGKFSLNANSGDVLLFSSVGFEQAQVTVKDKSVYGITLKSTSSTLNDVVVVGYGTVKRKDLTGAVSTLSSKAYESQPVLNTSSALQGRVAGVTVTTASGAPGAAAKIRIRGANSVTGSNDPLFVVDGIALGSLGIQDFNVNDIESMEVLKDASATAIYGSRGANGVVIVTTKSGKTGEPKIDYNGFVSFNSPVKKYDLLDAVSYAQLANVITPGLFSDPGSFAGKTTDWQDYFFNNSTTQNHQLSIAGGNERTKYYLAGLYVDQGGLLVNTGQKRYGFRSNVDIKLYKRLDFSATLYLSRLNSRNTGSRTDLTFMGAAPTEPVYDLPGTYNRSGFGFAANPYMLLAEANNDGATNAGIFTGKLKYTITDWLSFTSNVGLDMYTYKNAYLNNEWLSPGSGTTPGGGAGQSYGESYTIQNNNVLTLHKTFDKHDLTASAMMEATSTNSSSFLASGTGLTSYINGYYNLGLNVNKNISSGYSNSALLSYMGRIAYGYDDRYLLTATIRRDGSSKFQNNKWSNFPSFSAAWRLSNEKFISDLNFFSDLKLRAGWGMTGNQGVGAYSTLGLLRSLQYAYGSSTNYQAYTLGDPPNPDLKWETTKQTDVGIDIGLFNNRLNITADYYNKNTSDLLLYTPIKNYDGGGTILKNVGKVSNKGFELLIQGTPISTDNFKWSTGFNLSTNKNKVLSLGADSMIYRRRLADGFVTTDIQVAKVGQPMGTFYLIPWEGVYQSDEGSHKAGDSKYRDVSGNGSIGFEDRVIVGNGAPKFTWGFNNTVTYKNFELNAFVQGAHGNKTFNAAYAAVVIANSSVKYPTLAEAANYWTPSNTGSTFPNPASTSKTWVESTQFLQDASYIRLKNISLSYEIGKNILKVASAKIYVSAQNIATITKYKGLDPEGTTTAAGSDVDAGFDVGTYPAPKTITVGVRVGF